MKVSIKFFSLVLLFAVVVGISFPIEKGFAKDGEVKAKVMESYGKLPLSFIQNDGQVDERVKFYEKGAGHSTFFTEEGIYLTLSKDKETHTVAVRFEGAKKDPEIIAEGLQDGKVNYFIGNDPEKWRTNIPTYGEVVYRNLYDNVDVRFYGNNRQLEYDIIIGRGADPKTVKLSYEGIERLRVTEEGDLEISLKQGKIIQKKPYIYQEIDGKRVEVEGKFKIQDAKFPLNKGVKGVVYGFDVASYDRERPLIIDPVLTYSTYIGGSDYDSGYSIAVDTSGNAYVTGWTYSTNFPTLNPIQGSNAGISDAFVTKIDSSGTALTYSTYIGGSINDSGNDIAVDTSGNAYVTGYTGSTNFPTLNPIQGSNAGISDAFVTKIDSSGTALTYSTYIGGSTMDIGTGIAIDTSGNAYVTGYTGSTNFPTLNPIQGSKAGIYDAFVTKIDSSGTALTYSTYIGGSDFDYGQGIAVDTSGNAYVTGYTYSTNFPTLNPIQGSNAGYFDTFVTKIDSSGTALTYSTYIGGSSYDSGRRIAVDTSGNAYVTGGTNSTNFPTLNPIQGSNAGSPDAFVTKIDSSGTALTYSTYIGGSGPDYGQGIAVDTSGNAYVTGGTNSTNFPTLNPIQGSNAGSPDAFVTKIDSSGTALTYSTYIGGSINDSGNGIAVDTSGNAYVTGETNSTNFPTLNPIQGSYAGAIDTFVTKIGEAVTTYTLTITKLGTGTGMITSSPAGIDCGADCSEAYNSGAVVSLTATPDANSIFAGWSGDPDCSDGQVTMDTDKTCTATFNLVPKTLTITKAGTGSGTVTSSPAGIDCGADCTEDYNYGTVVTLTATPSTGSVFIGWSGDADCSDGVVTMDTDKTCTATFNLSAYTLSISVNGNGTVISNPSGINCPADCSEVFAYGTTVVLTATPSTGWTFTGWSGACTGTGICTVTINADTSVTATFTLQTYQFSNFSADVKIKLCYGNDKFKVKGAFTLNSGSDGISPLTENVSIQVGAFTATIPSGSFTQHGKGVFRFKGIINGVNLKMVIKHHGGNSYKYNVNGKNANLTGTANPVPVGLIIGNDIGNTSDMAKIKVCKHKDHKENDDIEFEDNDD